MKSDGLALYTSEAIHQTAKVGVDSSQKYEGKYISLENRIDIILSV